ncbi:MAG: FkbM family methyltransferase [Pirellula sp.]
MFSSLRRTANFITKHPIGKKQRLASWMRWLRWQVGTRILPYPVIVPWIGGLNLVMERGMTGATGNYYCGLHEFTDMSLSIHFLSGSLAAGESTVFVDAGANIGSFSLLAAGYGGAQVVAIEPAPQTMKRLERNVVINGFSNFVRLQQCALGESESTIRFSVDKDTMNSVVDSSYAGKWLEIPVQTLDALTDDFAVHMLKIDVEGFENSVLKGARKTLSNPNLKIVLLEGDDEQIQAIMNANGFARVGYDPFRRTFLQKEEIRDGNNNVWVRNVDEIESTCRLAPIIDVFGFSI